MTQCIGMGGKSNAEFHIRIESRGAPYLRDNVLSHGLLRWGRQFRLVAYYLQLYNKYPFIARRNRERAKRSVQEGYSNPDQVQGYSFVAGYTDGGCL